MVSRLQDTRNHPSFDTNVRFQEQDFDESAVKKSSTPPRIIASTPQMSHSKGQQDTPIPSGVTRWDRTPVAPCSLAVFARDPWRLEDLLGRQDEDLEKATWGGSKRKPRKARKNPVITKIDTGNWTKLWLWFWSSTHSEITPGVCL